MQWPLYALLRDLEKYFDPTHPLYSHVFLGGSTSTLQFAEQYFTIPNSGGYLKGLEHALHSVFTIQEQLYHYFIKNLWRYMQYRMAVAAFPYFLGDHPSKHMW